MLRWGRFHPKSTAEGVIMKVHPNAHPAVQAAVKALNEAIRTHTHKKEA